ncbi:hypothetical protein H0R90_03485 [Treponema putidum]|uniref:hypothetical protein n=1 Tax=Treponema putidum TaxID=221027 RepID=UPI00119A4107|nr:hypothetical protein [Treponema putidum]TWI78908.1 hypothetical protein JM98_00492 [Treponema putidum]
MCLKRKKNIFICILFCIFVIQIYSNDVSEVKINDGPIILRGKKFEFYTAHTKEDIEKELGKPTFYRYKPGRYDIVYEDDGFIISLTNDGIFEYIGINFEIVHRADVKGLIIEKGNTYSQIIKKLEKKKFDFTVTDGQSNGISIIVKFFNKNIGNTQLEIWLPDKENGEVIGLIYIYEQTNR